ncbi:DUF4260 family protein, partial [Bacillus cereus]
SSFIIKWNDPVSIFKINCVIYFMFQFFLTRSILIVLIGVYFKMDIVIMIGLIWTAHIGMDRMFGYGLKYETDFKDTHIQRL